MALPELAHGHSGTSPTKAAKSAVLRATNGTGSTVGPGDAALTRNIVLAAIPSTCAEAQFSRLPTDAAIGELMWPSGRCDVRAVLILQ